jgi:hypothetical protein
MAQSNFLTPIELAQSFVGTGIKKACLPIQKMILLGILAGVYIGLAAHLATTVATGWSIGGSPALVGLESDWGSVRSGLMMVVIPARVVHRQQPADRCVVSWEAGRPVHNWIPVYGEPDRLILWPDDRREVCRRAPSVGQPSTSPSAGRCQIDGGTVITSHISSAVSAATFLCAWQS